MESPEAPTATTTRRYAAFFSYSHADAEFANWLHKRLESYRVPSSVVGRNGQRAVGERLGKVFRDRSDLSAAHDLGSEITKALEASDGLIVLCSPRSAGSKYVAEEIRYFKQLGKGQRILAAILDGEPHAAGKPGRSAAEECFPRALIYRLGPDHQISEIPEANDPIAADFRPEKDGRENGALKLIAGILGVGFDDLVQRERQAERRRQRRAYGIAAGMSVLALGALGAGGIALWQRNVAQSAQDLAEEQQARAETQRRRAEQQQTRAEIQRRRAEAERASAEAQRQLAVGRALSLSAVALAKEKVSNPRSPLAALVVEALKRLPRPEAKSLAASMAMTLWQRIPFKLGDANAEEVRFVPGRRAFAMSGSGAESQLVDMDHSRIRVFVGGASAFLSSASNGRYIATIGSIVDVESMKGREIPAGMWTIRFSHDSCCAGSLTVDSSTFLNRFQLPSFSPSRIDLGKRGRIELVYLDKDLALLRDEWDGRLIVVDSQGEITDFRFPDGLMVTSVVSDGGYAFLGVSQSEPEIPDPEAAELPEIDSPETSGSSVSTTSDDSSSIHTPTPGKLMLLQGSSAGVYRLDLKTSIATQMRGLAAPIALQMSQNRRYLFVYGDSRIDIVDLHSLRARRVIQTGKNERDCGSVYCVSLADNDRWLAAKDDSGWNFVDLENGAHWHVPQDQPEAVSLSRRSSTAILVGDRDLAIVSLDTHSVMMRVELHIGPEQISVSDSGDMLAFGGVGAAYLARLDPVELQAYLCAQPGHNLDRLTWTRHLGDQAWKPTCPGWK